MDVFGTILFYAVGLLIVLLILYWLVWRVIHDSELAQDVKDIKQLLLEQRQFPVEGDAPALDPSSASESEPLEIDSCPACGERITHTDQICGSCGLTLISEAEDRS